MTKICRICGKEKDLEDFYERKGAKDGRRNECKECLSRINTARKSTPEGRAKRKERRRNLPPEKIEELNANSRRNYAENREKILAQQKIHDDLPENKRRKAEYDKEYNEANRDKIAERRRKNYVENKQKIRERAKRWESVPENKEKIREYSFEYVRDQTNKERKQQRHRLRMATDLQYKLAYSLRSRLTAAVKKEVKTGSAVKDLGCSVAELKNHIESKFQPGMTWKNWGKGDGKWNIDHIIPLSAFDLTQRQHVVLACHYLNLQPLWHKENMKKNDAYPIFEWSAT